MGQGWAVAQSTVANSAVLLGRMRNDDVAGNAMMHKVEVTESAVVWRGSEAVSVAVCCRAVPNSGKLGRAVEESAMM